jgi:hypothetical protein
MPANAQLHWIAEAEARCLRDSALNQRNRLEPPIGIVWAEPASIWRTWLQKTMARLAPSTPPRKCVGSSSEQWRARGRQGVHR